MSSAHFIFIPAVLALGMFLGFFLGARAAADRWNQEQRKAAAREEAKKKREQRLAKNAKPD